MTANKVHVATTMSSDPHKAWAKLHPIDQSKLERRMRGERTTEPHGPYAAGLGRLIVGPSYMPDVKAHVQLVVSSETYQKWATYKTKSGAMPHLTDHNKVMRRLKGDRTTEPSSNFARGLARLLYQPVRPPDEPDDPPPVDTPTWPADSGFMHPNWKKDLVFTRSLSSFYGLLRQEARANGFTGIAVQADHAYYVDSNMAELAKIRGTLVANGHTVFGWATAAQSEESPFDEGRRHAEIAKRHFPDGWLANAEEWAEGAATNMWRSQAWIDGWLQNGGADVPLACSCLSSTTDGWAREFDYAAWLRVPGTPIFPQVYGATYTAYTVHNALETLKRGRVPKNRVGLTFDVIEGVGPFTDYRTWPGVRQLWTGDDARSGTFAAFAR